VGSSHRTIVIGNGPEVAAANRKAPTRGETALGGGTNRLRLHLRLGGGQVGRIQSNWDITGGRALLAER
jgi:hypothetical protein